MVKVKHSISHLSPFIPVNSVLCNVTIFVRHHVRNFPCATKTTKRTLNYWMCPLVKIWQMCVSQEEFAHTNRGKQWVPRQSEVEETAGWCWWQIGRRRYLLYFKGHIFYLFLPVCPSPPLSMPLCCSDRQTLTLASCWKDLEHAQWQEETLPDKTNVIILFSISTDTIIGTHLQPRIAALSSQIWERKRGGDMNE